MSNETPTRPSSRVNKTPQQEMMEKVVAPLHPKDKRLFLDSEGEFLPLSQWPGVFVSAQGEVVKIHWFRVFTASEVLDIKYVPDSVTDLSVYGNNLCMQSYGLNDLLHK